MAKKLQKTKISMPILFLELLTPWIVMGVVAAVAFLSGLPDYAAIIMALVAALAVTFYIRDYEAKKRRSKAH